MDKKQIKKEMRELYEYSMKNKSYGGKDTDDFHLYIETADFENSRISMVFESVGGSYIGFFDGTIIEALESEEVGEYYIFIIEVKRWYN